MTNQRPITNQRLIKKDPLYYSFIRGFKRHAYKKFNRCQWCNKEKLFKEMTVDHIIPRSSGGKNIYSNLCLSCRDCNIEKSSHKVGRPKFGPIWKEPQQKTKNNRERMQNLGLILKEAGICCEP